MPAIACSFHWRGVPRQPRQSPAYIFFTHTFFALSLMTARSGIKAMNTNSELPMRYVPTALGSHTNGERTLGHTPRAKSYGNTQKSRQGLPTWNSGVCSAAISENTVITSAARVTGRRHSAWVSRSIAEIIIPAWLMPIQNTKLTRKNPQKTGRFRPVTPSPLFIMYPNAASPMKTIIVRNMTVGNHQRGVPSTPSSRSSFIVFWSSCICSSILPFSGG